MVESDLSLLGIVLWLSGMSGAGKSTLAKNASMTLRSDGLTVEIIDGDLVRQSHTRHLGFSRAHIGRNNAAVANICQMARRRADVVFVPVIAPYEEFRRATRNSLGPGFFLVHVDARLETLRARDPKGLYRKEQNGEIDNLIGVSKSSPYERPTNPDLYLAAEDGCLSDNVDMLVQFALDRLAERSAPVKAGQAL